MGGAPPRRPPPRAPPGVLDRRHDLREWIALLEREGELVRVAAEVDPKLEVTEIVDRVVKAGGPALLFEHPKGSSLPLLINQFGTERRMCLAFGVESLDDARRAGRRDPRDATAGGAPREGAGPADSSSRSPTRGRRPSASGACQEIVLHGDDVDLVHASGADGVAGRRRPVHHAARRDHARPARREAQRRHVPDAGARPAVDGDALAAAQGRARRLPLQRRADGGRGRARARPDHRLLRERAAPEAHRRAHDRRLPARRAPSSW